MGVFDFISGIMNRQSQAANLSWQKQVQREIWRREDNAAQRRVADLRLAGLSPTLAAGNAANAGAVVNTQAPQLDLPDVETQAMNLLSSAQNIAKSKAETALLHQKTRRERQSANLEQITGTTKDAPSMVRTIREIASGLYKQGYRNNKKNTKRRNESDFTTSVRRLFHLN